MEMTKKELDKFTGTAIGLFRNILYKIDAGEILSEKEFYSKSKEYSDYVLFVSKLMDGKAYDEDFYRKMGNFLYTAIGHKGLKFKNVYLDLLFWINESIIYAETGNLGECFSNVD